MDEIEFPNNYYGAWIRYKGTDLKWQKKKFYNIKMNVDY
jgi:hypothetical protein